MKTTGVVRRIDDLGRIVIPKEIRTSMRIRNGESMEIFVDDDLITLKKYSSLDELTTLSKILVESINKEIKKDVIITDMSSVIAFCGNGRKKYLSVPITSDLHNIINERKGVKLLKTSVCLLENFIFDGNCVVYPIISNGDVYGSILIFSDDVDIDDGEIQLIKVISEFLGKNIGS